LLEGTGKRRTRHVKSSHEEMSSRLRALSSFGSGVIECLQDIIRSRLQTVPAAFWTLRVPTRSGAHASAASRIKDCLVADYRAYDIQGIVGSGGKDGIGESGKRGAMWSPPNCERFGIEEGLSSPEETSDVFNSPAVVAMKVHPERKGVFLQCDQCADYRRHWTEVKEARYRPGFASPCRPAIKWPAWS